MIVNRYDMISIRISLQNKSLRISENISIGISVVLKYYTTFEIVVVAFFVFFFLN